MPSDTVLHALIADDEQRIQAHLFSLLSDRPEVGPVSVTEAPHSTLNALHTDPPDLVFLNTQFATASGLSIAEVVGLDAMPATIYISASDDFAVKAFELAAVDYLQPPFEDDRFTQAFERALQVVKLNRIEQMGLRIRDLPVSAVQNGHPHQNGRRENDLESRPDKPPVANTYLQRVTVEGQNQIQIVPVQDICYLTAEDTYVRIHTRNTSYLVRRRLYKMEQRLDPAQFVRIHRSTIVQLDCIERLLQRSAADYTVQLDNAKTFRVSRSRQDDLLRRLETGAPSAPS